MKKIGKYIAFGFFEGSPYDFVTDDIRIFERYKYTMPIDDIIKHIEELDPAVSSERGKDHYTGEVFQAMQYDDGIFLFLIEVLRYLRQGKIGIPKEYEDYIAQNQE